MRVLTGLVALCMLFGCGRTRQDGAPGSAIANAGAGGRAVGIGPIDSADLSAVLPMVCPNRSESMSFEVPCAVGQNFAGAPDKPGYHVVECQLSGKPGQVAVSFILPLKDLPTWLDEPISLPFPDVPPPPPGSGVQLGDDRYVGSLSGEITFEQVDVQGRAFVALLERSSVDWSGSLGGSFECSVLEGRLWAVAGSFL